MSLNNLGSCFGDFGLWEEAKRAFHESIRLLTPFWKAYPFAFSNKMQGSVNNYLRVLKELGQEPEEDVLNTIQALEKSSLDLFKLEQNPI